MRHIAENIAFIAKMKGIRMNALERDVGVSQGYFSRVRRSGMGMSVETVYRAAKRLGCSMDDVCDPDLVKRVRKKGIEEAIAGLQKELKELSE